MATCYHEVPRCARQSSTRPLTPSLNYSARTSIKVRTEYGHGGVTTTSTVFLVKICHVFVLKCYCIMASQGHCYANGHDIAMALHASNAAMPITCHICTSSAVHCPLSYCIPHNVSRLMTWSVGGLPGSQAAMHEFSRNGALEATQTTK